MNIPSHLTGAALVKPDPCRMRLPGGGERNGDGRKPQITAAAIIVYRHEEISHSGAQKSWVSAVMAALGVVANLDILGVLSGIK